MRVSGYGVAATFPVPGGANPYGITAGPRGHLWFTTRNSELGSMSLKGQFTMYPIPSAFGAGGEGGLAFRTPFEPWLPNNGPVSANVIRATIKPARG